MRKRCKLFGKRVVQNKKKKQITSAVLQKPTSKTSTSDAICCVSCEGTSAALRCRALPRQSGNTPHDPSCQQSPPAPGSVIFSEKTARVHTRQSRHKTSPTPRDSDSRLPNIVAYCHRDKSTVRRRHLSVSLSLWLPPTSTFHRRCGESLQGKKKKKFWPKKKRKIENSRGIVGQHPPCASN